MVLTLWCSCNRLVGLEEGMYAAWSQSENVYQRRADRVPNRINRVQGRDCERETLDGLVAARSKVGHLGYTGCKRTPPLFPRPLTKLRFWALSHPQIGVSISASTNFDTEPASVYSSNNPRPSPLYRAWSNRPRAWPRWLSWFLISGASWAAVQPWLGTQNTGS